MFEERLEAIRETVPSAKFSLLKLSPKLRTLILTIASGERIHPEIVRMQLGNFVKVLVLRAAVFTIPSKAEGLRVQSSEIHVGVPGVGKGVIFCFQIVIGMYILFSHF